VLGNGIEDRHDVLRWDERLDVVDRREDETAAGREIIDPASNFVADLLRRPEREDSLRVHAAAPEDEVAPEALLEPVRVHPACADLDRIDDIHPDIDQVRVEL
jgi:hypothetical protein